MAEPSAPPFFEREASPITEEMLRAAIGSHLRDLWTAMPVSVSADTEDGHTVSLKSSLKVQARNADGSTQWVELPEFQQVPIKFASGGGVTVTHPVKQGDEGFIVFASRAIDNWHQNGGVQQTVDQRTHSLADSFYVPGLRSDPRKLKDYAKDATQIRSDDGKHHVQLHPTQGVAVSVENAKHVATFTPDAGIKLLADGGRHVLTMHPSDGIGIATEMALALKATKGMKLAGNLDVTGNLNASGTIGAPKLSGFLSAFTGGLLGMLTGAAALMALAGAGAPSSSPQRVAYTLTALWSH